MRLTTFSRAVADRERLADQIELVPGRPARRRRDWRESAADARRRRRPWSRWRATLPRLMIETTLRATSEKLWSRPDSTFGGPFRSGENSPRRISRWRRALRRFEVAAATTSPSLADGQDVGGVVERLSRAGQPLVAHQHQELDFRLPRGRGRVEAARAVLDGVAAVGREGSGRSGADAGAGAPADRPLTG